MYKIIATILLLSCGCFHGVQAAALEIMLPQVYDQNINISGWLVSEKLDGVRAYWDGRKLISKNGNQFHPPAEFLHNFPDFTLEGELWGGRGTFEQTVGVVKRQQPHQGWLQLKFAIFDVPEAKGGFTERIAAAERWFAGHNSDYAFIIPQRPVPGKSELTEELHRVEKLGGEGLMVRRADAIYQKGRSADILKIKSYHDMEGVVLAHLPGKGRNKGKLGSLLVELPDGKRFKIGTGFSDKERQQPPPVGATVTFKYYGLYQSGLPKFPSFLRVREDNGL